MLLEQTLDKLRAMKLRTLADAVVEQRTQPGITELTFEDRLGLAVDREWDARDARETRRTTARLKTARLKQAACVEDIDFATPRGLDRGTVLALAGGHWISAHQNVIISGPTGAGKTFLACALGNRACRMGHSVLYQRVSRLLEDLALARADGSYARLMQRLAKADLLVLDDWGLVALPVGPAQDMLDVLEDRNGSGSTVIVTQIPVSGWHARIGDPTIADAILDRLVHAAHRIELRGESMRRLRATGAVTGGDPPPPGLGEA